jgi:LPS O-antigen subunit length determinant protein (WzzB/FepE family)
MGKVKSAEYVLVFENLTVSKEELENTLSNLSPVMKTTKSGKEKELDIKSMVYGSDVKQEDNKTILALTLAASGESYLNPDLVLVSMRSSSLDIPDEYDITRTRILFE